MSLTCCCIPDPPGFCSGSGLGMTLTCSCFGSNNPWTASLLMILPIPSCSHRIGGGKCNCHGNCYQTYSERRDWHWHRRRTLTPLHSELPQGFAWAVAAAAHSEGAWPEGPGAESAPQWFSTGEKKESRILQLIHNCCNVWHWCV